MASKEVILGDIGSYSFGGASSDDIPKSASTTDIGLTSGYGMGTKIEVTWYEMVDTLLKANANAPAFITMTPRGIRASVC